MNYNDTPKPVRSKLWTERDAVEKLEMLREVILGMRRQMDDVVTVLKGLELHMHAPDGRILRDLTTLSDLEYGVDDRRISTPMGLRDRE